MKYEKLIEVRINIIFLNKIFDEKINYEKEYVFFIYLEKEELNIYEFYKVFLLLIRK